MSLRILDKGAVAPLIEALMADYRVIGPQERGPKFVFDSIEDPDELRLDYTTTIIPPSKVVLQPAWERLATFDLEDKPSLEADVEVEPTILMGVHTCDLHAIRLLDRVFSEDYEDAHYLKRREQTLIVSLECLRPCDEDSFCKDMGTLTADEGYDLHLTDIGDAYAVNIGTERGAELLEKYAQDEPAEDEEVRRLNQVLSDKWAHFSYRLDFDADELPALLGSAYEHPLWEELGDRCFACGSCTNVCPTCYCFDVQDEVTLRLNAGERRRTWDSCQLDEFARVAGGENFREARSGRQRHRFMRKGKYIYDMYDRLGCVGCGRCIRTCLVHINIVDGFNRIHATMVEGEAQ